MGKWSYCNGEITEFHNAIVKEVKGYADSDLEQAWNVAGCPDISDFNLNLWNGSSGDGWACIDNSSDKDPEKIPMLFFVPYEDFRRGSSSTAMERNYRRACVVAHRLGLKRTPVVVTTLIPPASSLCNDTGLHPASGIPEFTGALTMPEAGSFLAAVPNEITASFCAPPRTVELQLGDILNALRDAGVKIHERSGEYIIMANEEELKRVSKNIQATAARLR